MSFDRSRVWLALVLFAVATPGMAEDRFVSLFDGKSLEGWEAVPKGSAGDWSVRDGAIVGIGSANRLAYLVWKERDLTNFELELSYRLPGKGNTGIEVRAQPDQDGQAAVRGLPRRLGTRWNRAERAGRVGLSLLRSGGSRPARGAHGWSLMPTDKRCRHGSPTP